MGGVWKSGFRRTKVLKSLKRGKIGPRLLFRADIGSPIRAFDWFQDHRPWVTLKGHYTLCWAKLAYFVATLLFCKRLTVLNVFVLKMWKYRCKIPNGKWRRLSWATLLSNHFLELVAWFFGILWSGRLTCLIRVERYKLYCRQTDKHE